MPVTCQTVITAMEEIAPPDLALDWDNAGLLLGSPAQEIKKVGVVLDVTLDTVEKIGANTLIISHHPLIFTPIKKIRTDLAQGKLLDALIKKDVAVYSSHTSFDIAPGGINDILAEKLGLLNTTALEKTASDKLFKLIVFVPEEATAKVRAAIINAGAGYIGSYSSCTFAASGTGTFLPLAGTKPYLGQEGRLEYVGEARLETVVPEKLRKKVIAAMLKAHPYEEAAYDELLLANDSKSYGLGRVGDLKEPLAIGSFINLVKSVLGVTQVNVAGESVNKTVRRAAVCGGSGASLISAAAALGADVFLTGDVKYHDAQTAADNGLTIIDAGHFATEHIFVPRVIDYLQKCSADNHWGIEIENMSGAANIFSVK